MKVFIFGLGAIGSNLFVQLIKQYPEWSFVGVDYDKVEARNLRTQAYFKEHINFKKTLAMLSIGSRYVQKLNYTYWDDKITKNTTLIGNLKTSKGDLWIDCFDNSESRQILKSLVPKDVHLLHLGFSPLYSAECIWNEDYEVPGDVDPTKADICSMEDAVGFIQSFIGLTLLNISDWVQNEKKRNFIITSKYNLRWL
jgi:molybdopterin/thiamine biosynthesis adenylyltransferase